MLDEGIEVNTVDKYQGRDKEVIIVSFTAKDQEAEVCHLKAQITTNLKAGEVMVYTPPSMKKDAINE